MKKSFNISYFIKNREHSKDACFIEEKNFFLKRIFQEISYEEFYKRVKSRSAYFEKNLKIKESTSVLLLYPVSTELYVNLTALLSLGATVTFIEPWMKRKMFAECVRRENLRFAFMEKRTYLLFSMLGYLNRNVKLISKKEGLCTDEECYKNINPETAAVVTYSTGSRGVPKPVVRTYGNLARQFERLSKHIATEKSYDLITFPNIVLLNLGMGGSTILPKAKTMERDKCFYENIFRKYEKIRIFASSSFIQKLSVSTLREFKHIYTGGSVIHPLWLKQRGIENKITIFYGSTEIEPIAVANEFTEENERGIFAGFADETLTVRINKTDGDIGEIEVSEDEEESFFKTGDVGYLKGRRLFLMGRVMDTIYAKNRYIYQYEIFKKSRDMGFDFNILAAEKGNLLLGLCEGKNIESARMVFEELKINIDKVMSLKRFPTDKRHQAKIDYLKLKKIL